MKKIPTRKIDASVKTPPRRILGTQRGSSKTKVNGRRKSNCVDDAGGGGGGGSAVKAEDIQRSVARSVTWKKTGPSKLLRDTLSDELHFDVEVGSRRGGVSAAVLVSLILHAVLIVYFIRNYHPVTEADRSAPMLRYVELIRQNPQFTEAPGPKTKTAPLNAAFSDANRRASTPNPTSEKPTPRPGQGGFYTPPAAKRGSEDAARARQA